MIVQVQEEKNENNKSMPLGYTDNKFAFMLHLRRKDFTHVENPNMMLMFSIKDRRTIEELGKGGVMIKRTGKRKLFEMTDQTGVVSELSIS